MRRLIVIGSVVALAAMLAGTAAAANWTDGTGYVRVRKGSHCVGAFHVTGASLVKSAYYEVRGLGGRVFDLHRDVLDETYLNCELPRGRYYKLRMTVFYYNDDFDLREYESRWVRFKIPR